MQMTVYHKALILLELSLLMLCNSEKVAAEPIDVLRVTPEQCVALTQGQQCYVDATLIWRVPTIDNYCLFSSQQQKPLACWQQQNTGQFRQEFNATKNIVFTLKLESTLEVIARQQLKVTWVHQKRGQPRTWWRVF